MPRSRQRVHRVIKGDRRTPLSSTLKQGGSAINLANHTVTFEMFLTDDDKTSVTVDGSVVVDTEASGEVSYHFGTNDVGTVRNMYGYFVVTADSGGKIDTFPVEPELLLIKVQDK